MLDLESRHRELVREILRRTCPGASVTAFGSRTRGTATRTSDLDLVVDVGRALGLQEIARVREAMSDSDLPMMVDIVDWYGLSSHLQEQVKQGGVVLSAPEGDPERG